MNNPYLEVISLVERLHRQFMEVVKLELEGSGVHDINNVQAMMLFNIGDVEMTVGELTLRGCYPDFRNSRHRAAKLEVFRGVRSKGRHHTGRCHGAATSTEAILGDG